MSDKSMDSRMYYPISQELRCGECGAHLRVYTGITTEDIEALRAERDRLKAMLDENPPHSGCKSGREFAELQTTITNQVERIDALAKGYLKLGDYNETLRAANAKLEKRIEALRTALDFRQQPYNSIGKAEAMKILAADDAAKDEGQVDPPGQWEDGGKVWTGDPELASRSILDARKAMKKRPLSEWEGPNGVRYRFCDTGGFEWNNPANNDSIWRSMHWSNNELDFTGWRPVASEPSEAEQEKELLSMEGIRRIRVDAHEKAARVADAKAEEYRMAFERCDHDGRNASRESWMLKDKMVTAKEIAAEIRKTEPRFTGAAAIREGRGKK